MLARESEPRRSNLVTTVDLRVAREVLRDRGGAHVLDGQVGQRLLIEAELAEVVREDQQPTRRKPREGLADQVDMVALQIELTRHALRSRQRGWIEKHE